MPTTFRIMFWNIQNVYEYKLVSPAEEESYFSIGGDGSPRPLKTRRVQQTAKYNKKLGGDAKAAFVATVNAIMPDVIVIAELSVGSTDLPTGEVVSSQLSYDNFVTLLYMTALNESQLEHLAPIRGRWASAISMVNATDLTFTESGTKVTGIKSKNSMFEQYGVVYRSDRLATCFYRFPISNVAASSAPVTKPGFFGQKLLAFPERAPGYVEFYPSGLPPTYAPKPGVKALLGVLMIHSVYGSTMPPRRATISLLSQLKSVEDAIKNGLPLAICGDFNLDYETEEDAYKPLTGPKPDLGMQVAIGNQKTARVFKQAADLKNAYDQIFLSGFSSVGESVAYNFVKELLYDDYNCGRNISDHLPVYTTVTIP